MEAPRQSEGSYVFEYVLIAFIVVIILAVLGSPSEIVFSNISSNS